jgi:hypothetical protein
MLITPLELLDTSIAQLQTLVAFLDEQLDGTAFTTPESYACKEIARSLCTLIRTCQAEGLARDHESWMPHATGVPL